jgi:hypothetical protein
VAAENFKVKKGLEVGTGITANSDGINVTGIITATQYRGDGSGLTGVVASGTGVIVKDEGSAVGTAGTFNFVGSGVAATLSAGTATVTIDSGGLTDVVDDTTPQLGGNLDLNSKFITGSGNIDITGSLDVSGISTFAGITTVTGETLFTKQLNVTGVSTFGNNINASGTSRFEIASMENGVLDGEISHNGDATTKIKFPSNNNISFDTDGTTRLNINNSGANITGVITATGANITGVITATGANITGIATFTGGVAKLLFNGNQKLTTTINGIEVPDLNVTGVGTVGRLDTSGVTLGTNSTTFAAKFIDDAVANFGTDNDLKISHDNAHARITNSTGDIVVVGIISATNGVKGALTGNADTATTSTNVTVAAESSDTTCFPLFTTAATGNLPPKSGTNLTFNSSNGTLTATKFAGDGSALTGVTASGTGIIVRHDGSVVGTASSINFSTNLDVSAISAGIVTVTASGSSGVSLSGSTNNTVATVTGANALIGEANLTFDGSTLAIAAGSDDMKMQLSGSAPYIQFREGTTNKAYIQWSTSGYIQLANEEAGEVLRLADGESGLIWRVGTSNRTVWTSGNDGASSGLDADLLDGQEGSYYTNATNLGSGTIPNGRFPATLPTVSGANLTNLPVPTQITIANEASDTSCNILFTTAATGDLAPKSNSTLTFNSSTEVLSATKFSGSGETLTNLNASNIGSGTMSASRLTGALPAISGANLTNLPAQAPTATDVQVAYELINTSSSGNGWRINGNGIVNTTGNPDLYLIRGQKYRFINNSGGSHPFRIQSDSSTAYSTGVTNNNSSSGNIDFVPRNDAPARLYYNCTAHGGMLGNIYLRGAGGNETNVGIITATRFSGDGSTLTNLNASNISSGQISSVRLTGALPAISGASLTNLNGSAITSGTVAANRVATLNQSTTGNAATATAFSVTSNNTTNETVYPVFVDGNSGTQGAEVDTGFTYNPSTNTLTTGTIDVGDANISSGTVSSSSSPVTVNTTAVGSCSAIEYTIFVSNSTNIQSQKVLIMDNGTTAYIQEFSVMSNPNLIVTFTADVNGGNVRLRATKESGISGSVSYKFSKMIIE